MYKPSFVPINKALNASDLPCKVQCNVPSSAVPSTSDVLSDTPGSEVPSESKAIPSAVQSDASNSKAPIASDVINDVSNNAVLSVVIPSSSEVAVSYKVPY